MATVYLSYRAEDSGLLAEALGSRLAQLGGHTIYPYALPRGSDVPAARRAMVQQADVMVVAIGPRWATIVDFQGQRKIDDPTDMVHQEIAGALWLKKVIIPILLAGGRMPAATALPPDLRPLASYPPFQPPPSPDSSREALGLHMKITKAFALNS